MVIPIGRQGKERVEENNGAKRSGLLAGTESSGECFTGTFIYTVDPKGRVIMPRRFRERLGTPFILTKGIGGCLLAMPRERWQPLVERYGNDSILFQRFYLAGAVECRPSPRSGRFLIPHPLREFAEIFPTQEATVAGVGQAVEIWNKHHWERACQHPQARPRDQLRFELDLEPSVSEPFTLRVRSLWGIAVVEASGALDAKASRLLAERLQETTPSAMPVIVVDLRRATRLRTAPGGLRWALGQQRSRGLTVCVLSEDPVATQLVAQHVPVFQNLEEALWWLQDQGPTLVVRGRNSNVGESEGAAQA